MAVNSRPLYQLSYRGRSMYVTRPPGLPPTQPVYAQLRYTQTGYTPTLPSSVTVAQEPLELRVQVRILARQPPACRRTHTARSLSTTHRPRNHADDCGNSANHNPRREAEWV